MADRTRAPHSRRRDTSWIDLIFVGDSTMTSFLPSANGASFFDANHTRQLSVQALEPGSRRGPGRAAARAGDRPQPRRDGDRRDERVQLAGLHDRSERAGDLGRTLARDPETAPDAASAAASASASAAAASRCPATAAPPTIARPDARTAAAATIPVIAIVPGISRPRRSSRAPLGGTRDGRGPAGRQAAGLPRTTDGRGPADSDPLAESKSAAQCAARGADAKSEQRRRGRAHAHQIAARGDVDGCPRPPLPTRRRARTLVRLTARAQARGVRHGVLQAYLPRRAGERLRPRRPARGTSGG